MKENERLSEQIIDLKERLIEEKSALFASAKILKQEVELKDQANKNFDLYKSQIHHLLPNFDKIIENTEFMNKMKTCPENDLDKNFYLSRQQLYLEDESIVMKDGIRLTSSLQMHSPDNIHLVKLNSQYNDLIYELREMQNHTVGSLQAENNSLKSKYSRILGERNELDKKYRATQIELNQQMVRVSGIYATNLDTCQGTQLYAKNINTAKSDMGRARPNGQNHDAFRSFQRVSIESKLIPKVLEKMISH